MEVVKNMRNQRKIKDVSRVLASFEEMSRSYAKGKNVLDVDGRPPRFYIRSLVECEDFVIEVGGRSSADSKIQGGQLNFGLQNLNLRGPMRI